VGICSRKDDDDTWMEPVPKKSAPPTSNGGYNGGGERRKPHRARRPKPWDDPQDDDKPASANVGAKSVTWSVVLENLDQMKLKDLEDLDGTAHDRKVQASVNSFSPAGQRSPLLGQTSIRSIFSDCSVMKEARESVNAAAGQNEPRGDNAVTIDSLSFCRNESVYHLQFNDDRSESGEWSRSRSLSVGSTMSDDGTKTTLTTLTAGTEESDDAIEKGGKSKDGDAFKTGLKKIRWAEYTGDAAAAQGVVVKEGEELEGGDEPKTRSKKIRWAEEVGCTVAPRNALV